MTNVPAAAVSTADGRGAEMAGELRRRSERKLPARASNAALGAGRTRIQGFGGSMGAQFYVTTEDRATIAHSSAERASVRNPASASADERAQRAGIVVGLIALVVEGTFAILSLAAVAFITSAFLASWAVSAGTLLLPRLGRSIRCQVR